MILPDITIWAYGSRIKGAARPQSDLDLAVFASAGQKRAVAALKEALEESQLPFRVDLFIWDEIPAQFRENIQQSLDKQPVDKNTMLELAKPWQPWRSVATWYLWRSLDPLPVAY
ncbi:nucleotidyltransferase domain-containing protein [Nitrosomonas sp.]|uniref:nucleotidyltransferase family protein n=1 Tax=Nitrosomonas sp. TaxID=42353 RepID=UPI0025FE8D2E|nr:nucleotidyltransferase domain-containing protein [Nitrosomonas sp.]